MNPSAEFIHTFGEMARLGESIKLYNSYRGIPIVYEARLLSVDSWYVTASVHEFQAVCLALENMTYIQNSLLPGLLRSRCINVDVKTREARLTEFTLGGASVGKRKTVRVQPREPTDVQLMDANGVRIAGILADVSSDGVGVVTFATYTSGELPFTRGMEIFAELILPESDQNFRFHGKIVSISSKGKFTNRLGLKLQPDPAAEPILRKYIAYRQEEILLEIKGVYESMCREKKKTGPLGLRPD